MRTVLFVPLVLALGFVAVPAAAPAGEEPQTGRARPLYKWVDEQGKVHYSDQPRPGAERVELAPLTTFEAAPVAPPRNPYYDEPPPAGSAYTAVSVLQPTADQVIWAGEGPVTFAVGVSPALQAGDRVVIYLDGAQLPGTPMTGTSLTVPRLDRGTHTVTAAVIDASGRVLIQSSPVTFHYRQPSKRKPP